MIRAEHFWEYIRERERVRLRRRTGVAPSEWTEDPILKTYSFTNVKRAHDRTSALLIREFYSKHRLTHPSPVALLNAAIFRYHGIIETARSLGWHRRWTSVEKERMMNNDLRRIAIGEKVWTSSYIIPNCGSTMPKHRVVASIIDAIWGAAAEVVDNVRWELMSRRLCDEFGVGEFMAKEVLLDYMLITEWSPTDWSTWTPIGPGAQRGASVVKYDEIRKIPRWEALAVCRELYDQRLDEWPADMVELDLTDIQFQLCEFAKYEKVRRGLGRPRGYFRPTVDDVTRAPGPRLVV
jgi:hypothetical protein